MRSSSRKRSKSRSHRSAKRKPPQLLSSEEFFNTCQKNSEAYNKVKEFERNKYEHNSNFEFKLNKVGRKLVNNKFNVMKITKIKQHALLKEKNLDEILVKRKDIDK